MASDTSLDKLFNERSFEEIESIKEELASEIEKRTESLKTIVKEKYKDVVETSDAIQMMKVSLLNVNSSMHKLDQSIAEFYKQFDDSKKLEEKIDLNQMKNNSGESCLNRDNNENKRDDCVIKKLMQATSDIWEHFDSDDMSTCVKVYRKSLEILKQASQNIPVGQEKVLQKLDKDLKRSGDIINNYLWYKIKKADVSKIGVITSGGDIDLYNFSLVTTMQFLSKKFLSDISDTSFQAQIRRYQPGSFLNTKTNQIDVGVDDLKPPPVGYVQLPKSISIELSTFLFETCQFINTIAGFSLTKTLIKSNLRSVVVCVLQVYKDLVRLMDCLKGHSKRRRALQLYFDLMYIRVLLNSSKSIELIEELDPQVSEISAKLELLLDSVELYMISKALHENVMSAIQKSIRIYALIVPNLQ